MIEKKYLYTWLIIFFAALMWSAVKPHDYFTWILEVFPALVGFVIIAALYKNFKFTQLTYRLILIHMIILMVGGHYTYAQVPLFNWIREIFNLSRNNYDKLGHFAQGFIPAIIIREILLRKSPLKRGKWLFFIVVSICLAFSAFYELIEWWIAALSGTAAEAFLSTQGYVWDTQSDMAMALIGAIIALLILGKYHDRQLSQSFPGQSF
jgi:putative membrane protein